MCGTAYEKTLISAMSVSYCIVNALFPDSKIGEKTGMLVGKYMYLLYLLHIHERDTHISEKPEGPWLNCPDSCVLGNKKTNKKPN